MLSQASLKQVVTEASQALIHLDAERLEELAKACRALNRPLPPPRSADGTELVRQAEEARADMAVFARLLALTRENLQLMERLRALREGPLGYSREGAYGDH